MRVAAPAKVTLTLRITGTRADGYHLIDAEMVTIDLADELTIDESGDGLSASGPYAAGMPLDASNLVTRALATANRHARVHIDKRVPHGGGLGGGSADAAAVLRWAGCVDLEAASRLGADVPFCVVGGRARVRGIGEIVEPLPYEARDLTIVMPPFACSTPSVYRAWDELAAPHTGGRNDLEPAALLVEPRLTEWRDRIREATGTTPTLAGSGSTWFVEGHRPSLVAALPQGRVVMVRTIPAD